MKPWRIVVVGLLAAGLGIAHQVGAQTFSMFQGNEGRTGQHNGNLTGLNPGRGFLRWWDPLFNLSTTLDNFEPGTTPAPGGAWLPPTGQSAINFVQEGTSTFPFPASYLYASPVVSANIDRPWDPGAATAPTFSWTFTGLAAGEDYAISVNIPIGPTDTDPNTTTTNLRFNATEQVYRITGVENIDEPGQPIYQRVNVLNVGGGWVRLGNNGNPTNRLYRVAAGSTQIQVTLIGTVPLNSNGAPVDDPSTVLVYADAARISAPQATLGQVTTQAIIATNQLGPFPWRTYAGRSQSLTIQDGSRLKDYLFPVLTSYAVDGTNVDPANTQGRRNIVWSWPVLRPLSNAQAETDRFLGEQADWVLGTGPFAAAPSRADQAIQVDNTNGNVRVGAAWTPQTTRPNFRGVDYLEVGASAASTSEVVFAPKLPEGRYFIEVWIPGGASLATGAQVEIRRAGITVDTDTIDMNASSGTWVRLQVGSVNQWDSTDLAPLTVAITGTATPATGNVVADQVRFIRVADLAMRSTPVFTRAVINDGSTIEERDIVLIALENGRVYCVDAIGFQSAGVPLGRTQTFWVYPSETTGADPNHVAGEDGEHGIAEMPAGFLGTSGLVAAIGSSTPNVFYIGSSNGRVYALNIEGRGDGTTTRRWTWPNDYPAPSVESALGPILGSVSFANTPAGPTLFVPTMQGRLYALNAAGDVANKTTDVRFAFPGVSENPVGTIAMAPVVANGTVFFGTGNGLFGGTNTFYAVNAQDPDNDGIGNLLWSRSNGVAAFTDFLNISPTFIAAAELTPNPFGAPMGDTIVVGNTNFEINAFDAATGNLQWSTAELATSPSGPLGFTRMRLRLPGGSLNPTTEAAVMVPFSSGTYAAFFAQTGRTNQAGGQLAWRANLSVSGPTQPMAFGGPNSPFHNYMVGSDPSGYLYGWSWDPTLPDGGQTITPGEPPIEPQPDEPDDPTSQVLNDIASQAEVSLILPNDYNDLQTKAANGTITEADVTAALNRVTRTNFEFGETLHVLVHTLPDPDLFSPQFPYTVDLLLNARGVSSQRFQFGLTPIPGAPQSRNRLVLARFSILGIGQNALIPGDASLTVRILSVTRPGANATVANSRIRPSHQIRLANPLAVALVDNLSAPPAQQVGLNLSPADPDNVINGTPPAKTLIQPFRPELNEPTDVVAHGQSAITRLFVYDRSLTTLLFGNQRGLSSVRMQLGNLNFLGSPVVPLPLAYAGLEDTPGTPGNNVSLDYPDIRRDRMQVTKSLFGAVENPLFQPVNLVPPSIQQTDLDDFNSNPVQYNQFLDRTLVSTPFDFELSTPRFQPPASQGYQGRQFVFVDSNAPGRQIVQNRAIEPFREFGLGANVAVDQRPTLGTVTLDLGSIPAGGGFLPAAPWNAPNYSLLDPLLHDAARAPFFQRFTVFNEGNVNLLNVRVAKQIQDDNSTTVFPVVLGAPGLHPLAGMDARLHLLTDIDPFFAGRALAGNPALGDRVILQKARPDDGEPTRLRVNPRRRTNANLEVVEGDLLPVTEFASATEYEESRRDPKLAVSVPIGTPVGSYLRNLFVFEDTNAASPSPRDPSLDRTLNGAYEPYSDAPLTLRFNVRETRLTTSRTSKAMNMADNIPLDPGGRFSWANQQPTATRAGDGTLVVALSSDRLLNGTPAVVPSAKTDADAGRTPQWRIYFFSLTNGSSTPVSSFVSLSDLDRWSPAVASGNPNTDRWFNSGSGAFPTATNSPTALFGIPPGELDLNSIQFTQPVFPAAGFFEPLSPFTTTGKANRGRMLMAFVGEATRQTASGERRRESRLMLSSISLGSGGGVSAGTPIPLAVSGEIPDPQARLGRPSVVQAGDTATVFYPITAAGTTQVYFSHFNGSQWVQLPFARRFGGGLVSRLRTGDAFESVSAPSATLRSNASPAIFNPFNNQITPAVIEVVFTGRLRGRSQAEVYMMRVTANGGGVPTSSEGTPWTRGPGRRSLVDPLTFDAASGLYWSEGADWQQDFSATNGIDLQRLNVVAGNRVFESILVPGSAQQAEGSSVVSYATTLGGRAFIDLAAGSVRFSGTVIPRNLRIYARYRPRVLRVSTVTDHNHRAASMLFDDRTTGDNSFWYDSSGTPITAGFERSERWLVGYGRTAARNPSASRPYLVTFRAGVRLPFPIEMNGNVPAQLNFAFTDGTSVPFQLEPGTGRIYFPALAEGRAINITYRALNEDGTPLGSQTFRELPVQMIEEQPEFAIPIEQVSNESAVSMSLDALGGGQVFNRPALIWMFWSSTRAGGTDVFFQTLAPRFTTSR